MSEGGGPSEMAMLVAFALQNSAAEEVDDRRTSVASTCDGGEGGSTHGGSPHGGSRLNQASSNAHAVNHTAAWPALTPTTGQELLQGPAQLAYRLLLTESRRRQHPQLCGLSKCPALVVAASTSLTVPLLCYSFINTCVLFCRFAEWITTR